MLLTQGTGRGKRSRGTGKWKMGTKPNLNTSPISNSISTYYLLCFHFLFSRSPLPVPRYTSLDGLQTRNCIQCEFLLLYFFVIRDVFERILLRNGGNNTHNKIWLWGLIFEICWTKTLNNCTGNRSLVQVFNLNRGLGLTALWIKDILSVTSISSVSVVFLSVGFCTLC